MYRILSDTFTDIVRHVIRNMLLKETFIYVGPPDDDLGRNVL
jgi:hypothetical protein